MAPEVLERLGPVKHGFQLLWVEPVHALPTALFDGHDLDFTQDAEMFGHRRLREPEGNDQRADSDSPAPRQKFDDLPPPRLGNGVEDISGRGGAWHASIIFPYGNMSRAIRHPPLQATSSELTGDNSPFLTLVVWLPSAG